MAGVRRGSGKRIKPAIIFGQKRPETETALNSASRWQMRGEEDMRLRDKVAIVTGAAHGMGEAEARLFAKEGAKVVVADILASDAERVAGEIRAAGGEATAAQIDVTREPEWQALIQKTLAA